MANIDTYDTYLKDENYRVYLASEEGFSNFCKNCSHLADTEKISIRMFDYRVACNQKKCDK